MEGRGVPRLGLLVQASGEGQELRLVGDSSPGVCPLLGALQPEGCVFGAWPRGRSRARPLWLLRDLLGEPPPLPASAWPCCPPSLTRWTPLGRLREPAAWP